MNHIRKPCDDIDSRFIRSEENSLDEESFFKINGIYEKLKSELPKIDISPIYNYNHYYRNYIYLTYNCRDSIDMFVDNQKNLDYVEGSSLILLIFCSILGAFLIFFEWWYAIA